ncbi:MAG: class I SAM-dependent methyltransferase [Betaproteobacteria bacterium]|nr:MAG: class I SAM-dependent methyltransferase [Betaproteobacteria bacterium]TMI03643.1 MAG: class I SAM-dependent methyltransferase [Betaproteobacteria bacterium]
MASDLTFTGERCLPHCSGEIAYQALPDASFDLVVSFETIEHLHSAGTRPLPARREAVARRASGTLVNGRRT